MAGPKTRLKASYIIVFEGGEHRYLRDGELVFQDEDIVYVGKGYEGETDRTIEAAGKIVAPGLISTHAHLSESPMDRSFVEDRGSPQFYNSGLFEYLPARGAAMDIDARRACLTYSLAELLRSGTTTVVEIGPTALGGEVARLVETLGNRVYFAPSFRSGRWYTPDGKRVLYEWSDDGGEAAREEAFACIEQHDGACGGLVRGLVSPGQIDTCTEELFTQSGQWARRRGMPLTTHISQSVNEFNEMLQRHGCTPVAWLRDIGFLQPDVILGHAIIIGGTSWANYPAGDLDIIAETGCSVAHAPWVFARRGMIMESFQRYERAGIRMTLGTDTCPQNMIQAMRWAAVCSKIVERGAQTTTAADVFNAATLGGAAALGRDDLGRLCPGAKADIVIFDGESMNMTPVRDPVKNIVYNAECEDVETVIINGRVVLDGGRVLGADADELCRALQQAAKKMWTRLPEEDWQGRAADDFSPMSFRALAGREKPSPPVGRPAA